MTPDKKKPDRTADPSRAITDASRLLSAAEAVARRLPPDAAAAILLSLDAAQSALGDALARLAR